VLVGYERAFVVDCVVDRSGPPGRVERLSAEEFQTRSVDLSSHYAGLPQVLALGERLGLDLPHVEVLAVSVEDPYRIGTEFSPELCRRLPAIAAEVEHALLEADRA
jgi:hydrogenase maturation protease